MAENYMKTCSKTIITRETVNKPKWKFIIKITIESSLYIYIFFFFKDFIYLFMRDRERGRNTGRERCRLHAGNPMWDPIPGFQDHTLS